MATAKQFKFSPMHSVFVYQAIKKLRLNRETTRVIIQGFGNVGSNAALLMAEAVKKAGVPDGLDLPFSDATFDSVSVRFGYMFFPDLAKATAEKKAGPPGSPRRRASARAPKNAQSTCSR